MLRSLVGSEMCIRDRLSVDVAICASARLISPVSPDGEGPFGSVGTDIGGCLLYTSDAADDLLCVDLGGRRIIKKKKNTIISFKRTNKTASLHNTISNHTS